VRLVNWDMTAAVSMLGPFPSPSTSVVLVTFSEFASLLLNPSIDLCVSIMAKDTRKWGGTKANVNIVGQILVLFHASRSPSDVVRT